MTSHRAPLHLLQLLLQLLDLRMRRLEILVETVSLTNQLLLPRTESTLFDLDLLGESLTERFLFLLELGVVELPWSSFAEFAGLHLLSAIGFVVVLLGGVDEVEHVSADEDGAKFLEVAVFLIFDFCDAPGVLTALDDAAVMSLDILLAADDGEWHGRHESAGVLQSSVIVLFHGGLVDLDTLSFDDRPDAVLEASKVLRGECVCFGNNGNEIDSSAETLHHFDVKRFERVAGGADEVEAGMDAKIDLITTARLLLLEHVGLMLVIKELDDGHPRVAVVHIVTEARGVDDSQSDCGRQ